MSATAAAQSETFRDPEDGADGKPAKAAKSAEPAKRARPAKSAGPGKPAGPTKPAKPEGAPRTEPGGDGQRLVDPEDEAAPLLASPPPKAPSPWAPHASLLGRFYTQLGFDAVNDGREPGAEWRTHLYVRATVEASERLRAVVGGRFRYTLTVDRPGGGTFLLFNGGRPRGLFDADLWEAHVDLALPGKVDLRVGQQVFHWGAADLGGPSDVLNPIDARFGPFVDEGEWKLPVFAVSATWRGGPVNATAAWMPFFVPMRARLFAAPFALAQPFVASALPDPRAVLGDPALDALERGVFEASAPPKSLANGQGGARIFGRAGGVDFGVSYVNAYEPYPTLAASPALARALGGSDPRAVGAAFTDPASPPFNASYARREVFGFDLTAPLGPLLLRVDAGYSPLATVYAFVPDGSGLSAVAPVRRPMVTYLAALEWRPDDELLFYAQWMHSITVSHAGEALFLLHSNQEAILLGVRARFLDERLSLSGAAGFGVSERDWAVFATVGWTFPRRLQLALAMTAAGGDRDGPFGWFGTASAVYARFAVDF